MRYSRRPSKQFLFYKLKKIFRFSEGRETGLDVACGKMIFQPWFKTKNYIGLDLDPERIAIGTARFPQARGIVSSIENMPGDLKGDFVTCFQTIGINDHFKAGNTLRCAENLVKATRKGGILVFNIGLRSRSYDPEIRARLKSSFAHVEGCEYGVFSYEVPVPVSLALCGLMLAFPFIRTWGRDKYFLYTCMGKISED